LILNWALSFLILNYLSCWNFWTYSCSSF